MTASTNNRRPRGDRPASLGAYAAAVLRGTGLSAARARSLMQAPEQHLNPRHTRQIDALVLDALRAGWRGAEHHPAVTQDEEPGQS